MLNKVILAGRLTRDPEIKKTGSGVSVCTISIACDRDIANKQTGERETDFFDVTAWRSTADFVGKHFSKGRMIQVVGRLQRHDYTDKDGNKRYVTDVLAESVYFGDTKKSAESDAPAPAASSSCKDDPPADDSDEGELPF